MDVKQVCKTSVRFLVMGFLATLGGCLVTGCNNSQAVSSSEYQKLPPGEGERRLKDTLERRAQGKSRAAPLPADVRVDQQK